MSYFSELKRRHVFRVGATYAVIAWLLLQIADTVFPTFNAPEWVMPVVTFLIILGFPLTLILAWAFEITPSGIMTDRHARDLELQQGVAQLPSDALITAANTGATNLYSPVSSTIPFDRMSIAVLPLANLSPNPENAFFASGVHEEILDQLAKISELNVISRMAVTRYQQTTKSPSEIAQELKVNNIMEGSVRFAGNNVKITTQLIRAVDNMHLWSESYMFELDDIFKIQADVAKKVATAMQATLLPDEKISIERAPTKSIDAYTLFLQHRYQYEKEQARPTLDYDGWIEAGIRKMDQAVLLDPLFARGMAELGWLKWYKGLISLTPEQDKLYDEAIYYANKALLMDPSISRAYQVLHRVYFHRRQWVEWEAAARKSVDLPDLEGTAAFNMALTLGLISQFEEAFYWFDITLSKSSYFSYYWETAIAIRIGAKDYETAVTMADNFRLVGGDANSFHIIRAYGYNRLGMTAEYERELSQVTVKRLPTVYIAQYLDFIRGQKGELAQVLEELDPLPDHYAKQSRIVYCAAGAGDIDTMFASFEHSMKNEQFIYYGDVISDDVKADPRWQKVESYMNLPEAKNAHKNRV